MTRTIPRKRQRSTQRSLAPADTESSARFIAIRSRDARADGTFVYCVETTGIYCRPSCAARTPNRENVIFHDDPAAAERAGFRACKRCRPNEPPLAERQTALIVELCRMIERSDDAPTLRELARAAQMSVFHVQRLFRDFTGVTPKAYAQALRNARVQRELQGKRSVTDAIYRAGFNSPGRFYEQSGGLLGMTPSQYRTGASAERIRFAIGECSLGSILVAATERGVCAVLLGDDPAELIRDLQTRFSRADLVGGDERFERLVAQAVGLVERPCAHSSLPLDVRGTAFQQRVWSLLSRVGPGETTTYTALAEALGAPKAVRAVAGACAANPVAVAIPCHRVVRLDGSLAGYRWGVERKRELLEREARR